MEASKSKLDSIYKSNEILGNRMNSLEAKSRNYGQEKFEDSYSSSFFKNISRRTMDREEKLRLMYSL